MAADHEIRFGPPHGAVERPAPDPPCNYAGPENGAGERASVFPVSEIPPALPVPAWLWSTGPAPADSRWSTEAAVADEDRGAAFQTTRPKSRSPGQPARG